MAELDLLIYTYQTLIPSLKPNLASNIKYSELLEETSLDQMRSFESQLEGILNESPQMKNELGLLYYSKLFIKINEQELITFELAAKAVECLNIIKSIKADIDVKSCAEDLVSNLDSCISSASIDELYEWSKFVESHLQDMISKEIFVPVLSIRIKSLLWSLIQTSEIEGHIKLAETLLKCNALKFISLSEMTDIIADQCLEFLETENDTTGIEKSMGNIVRPNDEKSKKLFSILCSIEIDSKESQKRLDDMKKYFQGVQRVENIEEVRINRVKSSNEISFEDVTIYHKQKNKNGVETLIRKGKLRSGVQVAVKIYTFSENSNEEKYYNEIKALETLSGQKECFLSFYGGFREENKLYIVTELCEKTLAEDLINRQAENSPYSLDEKLQIMNELLEGFTYMNMKKIYHRDIKPLNIMFTSKRSVKIIDFNTIINMDENDISDSLSEVSIEGTKNWMSPEVLTSFLNRSDPAETMKVKPGKSDIFSLGLVFLSLFTFNDLSGKNLDENNQQLQKMVEESVYQQSFKDLIQRMVSLEPEKRPSFKKALAELPCKSTQIN